MTVISEYLRARGIEVEEIPHEPAHTALGEAAQLGVPGDEVAKTIVLDTREGHALAVIPASERLDMRLVHVAVDDAHAKLASEDEMARDFPDYELGALPPLGSLLNAPLLVDPRVMDRESIVFAAGTASLSLRARTRDLFRDENPVVTGLVRDPGEGDKELIGP